MAKEPTDSALASPSDGEAVVSLDERMEAAGMIPLSKLLSGDTPLGKWEAHKSVRTLAHFEEWLLRRHREFMTMRAKYAVGDKDESDELYEWVLAHAGAFSEVVANWRQVSALALSAPGMVQVPETDRASLFLAWACETFTSGVARNIAERLMRFAEEAVELAMACDMPRDTFDKIVSRVYGREPGNIKQETAQCQVTLELLAKVLRIDLDAAADEEFQRVKAIPKEHWERRHAAKVALGIATEALAASPTQTKGAEQ